MYFKLYLLVLILAAGTAHCVEPWKVSAEHWTVNVKNVQGWQLSSSHSSQSVLNNVLMLLRVHFLGSGIFWRHCALITKMFNNYHHKHDTVLLQENQPFTQTILNIILWLLSVTLVKWNHFIVILCLPHTPWSARGEEKQNYGKVNPSNKSQNTVESPSKCCS